ncbi:MAG: hypothetical protein ACWGOL_01465 [Desulfuromonadales bacterium]
MRLLISAVLMMALCLVVGCEQEAPGTGDKPVVTQRSDSDDARPVNPDSQRQTALAEKTTPAAKPSPLPPTDRTPPGPPLLENFQAAPQLRLFPWVGDFRPAIVDQQQTHWQTLIKQLVKGTSIAEDQATGSRAWVFSGIEGNMSSGYFAPLRVEPQTSYQVSFKLTADLQKDSTAGIRIIEFDEFLWIGEQYTEEQYRSRYQGSHKGKRLTGKVNGQQSIIFTTGADTHMIHLVLFQAETHAGDRIMFDDIQVIATDGRR